MPLYLDVDRGETRATTPGVMAAIERGLRWLLWGPRQHPADLLRSLGPVSPANLSERSGKRS